MKMTRFAYGPCGRARSLAAFAVLAAGLLGAAMLAVPAVASAATVTSTDLVEEPARWDGEAITFTGEAIGETMVRGDEAWLHLNDDAYANGTLEEDGGFSGYNSGQAIVLPPKLADAITVYGDHDHRGDTVEVTGVFNAACAQHGGDMDIHATTLRIVSPGREIAGRIANEKLVMLGIAALAAALAGAAYRNRHAHD